MTNILSRDNRLFALTRQSERQPSALQAVAVVIAIVVLMIAAQVAGRVVVRLIHLADMQSDAGSIVEGVSGFLAACIGLGIWLRLWSKRSLGTLGFEKRHIARHVLTGTLVALLMIAAAIGLEIIPGASFSRQEIGSSRITMLSVGFLSLLSATLHASAEEAVFRGWLLPSIGSRYGAGIGIAVSAVLFSLLHAPNVAGHSNVAPLAFLNLLLFGAFAAIYALAEGGLWGICAWHAVWNWAQGDLLGLPVSGGVDTGLLVSIQASGPAILTGGTFGPEGGLAATGVLLAGILALFIASERSK